MSEDSVVAVLTDIRNWTRAASYSAVKALLQEALPEPKYRAAYQMLDGNASMEQVRIACKMSPNNLVALAQRCTSMGLMEMKTDKRRVRLFDLADFDLVDAPSTTVDRPKK
jgi:hypothetical protein